jgi:hypothetical protein
MLGAAGTRSGPGREPGADATKAGADQPTVVRVTVATWPSVTMFRLPKPG